MTEPIDHDLTNADRAERCRRTLEAYNDEYDLFANVIDLLADLRHWCDAQERDYAEFDRIAYLHYLAEFGPHDRRPS
jgi:hypothetical protein